MDSGSAVSLLPSTIDSKRYYDPQDLLAVNRLQLIVKGLKTLNVHLGSLWHSRLRFFVLSWFSC